MYQLGDITLKSPVAFVRTTVETSGTNRTLTGRTVKDIINRKEQYVLSLQNLTQVQVTDILGEWNLQTTRDFTVNETNLSITATPVHINIAQRDYVKGADYRENIVLVLTEVV